MWKDIILSLSQCGLSDAEIGKRVGVNQSTITRLKNGQLVDTAYRTGRALIELRDAVIATDERAPA